MPRIDVNRSGEMEAFVQVIEFGGFSSAARLLGMTPSAVSKLVARLELRLGIQLVHRSTRKLQLTPEGTEFYERSTRVLADMDEAERCAAAGAAPRGRVSINASVSFGHHKLVPLVPRLLEQHPQITLDIALTDRIVDLMDERADIAIRWGALPSSDLVARRLGETSQAILAAPSYLEKYGTPRTPQELEAHSQLGWTFRRSSPDWPFRVDGRMVWMPVAGPVRAGDGETLRQLAMAGAGVARLSLYHTQHDIDAGRLVPLLEEFNPCEVEPIHAVYIGKAGTLPARVRAVLDFLVACSGVDGGRYTLKRTLPMPGNAALT
ncbi:MULTISPECIES: LysR substrate-binding domain-containing protein [unclassified Variovorax]|uniref:LysR substrate-binding domain-containing protein n=1 Tax=unclassified Variovorax TaxID=663243 RepID=UPI003F45EF77